MQRFACFLKYTNIHHHHTSCEVAILFFIQTTIGEYENISTWARMNNLRRNKSKTREMVIMRRGRAGIFVPQVIPEAETVDSIKVLGITLRSDLRMTSHVDPVRAAS